MAEVQVVNQEGMRQSMETGELEKMA